MTNNNTFEKIVYYKFMLWPQGGAKPGGPNGPGSNGPNVSPAGHYATKQPYSPYGSPGASGSPQYLPGRGPQSQGQYGAGTPPRPPSCPGQAPPGAQGTVQISQVQQMHVQHNQIQVGKQFNRFYFSNFIYFLLLSQTLMPWIES